MMLSTSILVIFVFSNPRAFGPARYVAECTGGVVGFVNSIRCLAVVIVP